MPPIGVLARAHNSNSRSSLFPSVWGKILYYSRSDSSRTAVLTVPSVVVQKFPAVQTMRDSGTGSQTASGTGTRPLTVATSRAAPFSRLLGDVATSFAESARSYDDFLGTLTVTENRTSASGGSSSLKFTSASQIEKLRSFTTDLRAQLDKMESVLIENAILKTRVEVTAPNGDCILAGEEFRLDAGEVSGPGSGPTVEDVTMKLREEIEAWRKEQQAELVGALVDAYEEWFPAVVVQGRAPVELRSTLPSFISREIREKYPVEIRSNEFLQRQRVSREFHESWENPTHFSTDSRISREIFRDRVRVRCWGGVKRGSRNTAKEVSHEGSLVLKWTGTAGSQEDAHNAYTITEKMDAHKSRPGFAFRNEDGTHQGGFQLKLVLDPVPSSKDADLAATSPRELSFSFSLDGANGFFRHNYGRFELPVLTEQGKLRFPLPFLIGGGIHGGSQFLEPHSVSELEFINGGAERAEVVRRKILTFCGSLSQKERSVLLSRRVSRSIPNSCFHHAVDIGTLDTLNDGRTTELMKKFDARQEIDHPFLSSFSGFFTPPTRTPITAVEVVPFVGAPAGEQVDPEFVQSSSLLDLAMDASFAEFCPSDGSVVFRFHAIVAARADPAR